MSEFSELWLIDAPFLMVFCRGHGKGRNWQPHWITWVCMFAYMSFVLI